MKRIFPYIAYLCLSALLVVLSVDCTDGTSKSKGADNKVGLPIRRYDLIELRFLTTGDYSALQEMKGRYVDETRVLVENVLGIGEVNSQGINAVLHEYFQDSTLARIVSDVETEFYNMDEENALLADALERMKDMFPQIEQPEVYTQIGDLGQSIVVSGSLVGVSLDKYLGQDYPIYLKYYSKEQRTQMERSFIVPDCLSFFLLSKFPLKDFSRSSQTKRDFHIQCIWAVVNELMDKEFYDHSQLGMLAKYEKEQNTSAARILLSGEYNDISD